MNLESVTNSAVLLMSIGEEEAAGVLKLLAPHEVQRICAAMTKIRNVTREHAAIVLDKFAHEAERHTALSLDSSGYMRSVLSKALGEEEATAIIDRVIEGTGTNGIRSLKSMDPLAVAELVKGEHPQIVATILVYLERDQASKVVGCLSESLRNEVLLRVATLESIQPTALRELDEVLNSLLSGSASLKRSQVGGARTAAEILNFLPRNLEQSAVDSMRSFSNDLAQMVVDQMFVFDNLLGLDDQAIQVVLREVDSEVLVVALKGAAPEMREKFLSNMSLRAGELLADELDALGPVRVSEIDKQQRQIVQAVRNLAERGEIMIGNRAEDEYL